MAESIFMRVRRVHSVRARGTGRGRCGLRRREPQYARREFGTMLKERCGERRRRDAEEHREEHPAREGHACSKRKHGCFRERLSEYSARAAHAGCSTRYVPGRESSVVTACAMILPWMRLLKRSA